MKRWILTGLLVVSMCGAAMAGSLVLSEKDKSALQSVGISANDKMITELNEAEQVKFRAVLDTMFKDPKGPKGENPAVEAKTFLVTRWCLRKVKKMLPEPTPGEVPRAQDIPNVFTAAELREIKQYSLYRYTEDLNEQLLLWRILAVASQPTTK